MVHYQVANPEIEEDIALDELIAKDTYRLRLHNDDYNTFDWVIECLVEICGHSADQAEQCAIFVHFKGSYVVKSGAKKDMELLKEKLQMRKLSVTVEEIE